MCVLCGGHSRYGGPVVPTQPAGYSLIRPCHFGFSILQHFDPRISWRNGTLTIVCGTGSWSVPTCPIFPVQPTALAPVLSPDRSPTWICEAPASKQAFPHVFPSEVLEGFLGHTSSSATYQVPDQTPRSRPIHEGQRVEVGVTTSAVGPAPYVAAKSDLGSRDFQPTADRGYVLPPAEAGYSTPFEKNSTCL